MKRSKVIVLTGGGSGGHLTPILSVAEAIKKQAPEYSLMYIGQKGDGLGDIMHSNAIFDKVFTVRAGKFRRYHGEGFWQVLNIKTLILNARDALYTLVGIVQAHKILQSVNPRVVFCKGGFVSVPVGLAAALQRIPYITHDSDAIPGLANRIISKWATIHAVALPKELYKYPASKTITVGVPIQSRFKKVTEEAHVAAKEKLGIPKKAWVLFIIGGGLGAERVNTAVTTSLKSLFKQIGNLYILHVTGRASEESVTSAYSAALSEEQLKNVQIFGFTDDVVTLGEAADVVLTRAGATNMAEFAVQGKACIIVPNPILTGGHQTKNAQAFANADAALILSEPNLPLLAEMVTKLHSDKQKQQELAANILAFGNKQSSTSLAGVLLTTANKD